MKRWNGNDGNNPYRNFPASIPASISIFLSLCNENISSFFFERILGGRLDFTSDVVA